MLAALLMSLLLVAALAGYGLACWIILARTLFGFRRLTPAERLFLAPLAAGLRVVRWLRGRD